MAEGNWNWLKKTGKITSHGGGDDVASYKGIDRLSDLPDSVLHHILSFLDTKSLFRTSLLSRRWGCVWKEVAVLNFSWDCFKSTSIFAEHVPKFLSLRSEDDSAAVSTVSFGGWSLVGGKNALPSYTKMFDGVMKHAASHGPRRPSLHHLNMSSSSIEWFDFVDLAASIKAHHHHRSLKTLNLKSFSLELGGGGGSGAATLFHGFNLLTNLELDNCYLRSSLPSPTVVIEPFIDLPCLKRLKLVGTWEFSSGLLKVSGPELVDLQIQNLVSTSQEFEVLAPKLKSFLFWGCLEQLIQLDLPSLDHANIRVRIRKQHQQEMETTNRACLKLLSQLHNAESLHLRFDKTTAEAPWEEHEFPLIGRTELLAEELQVSPFTRLRRLRVWYPYKPPTVPYQVIRYLSEGSPHDVRKSFKFPKNVQISKGDIQYIKPTLTTFTIS